MDTKQYEQTQRFAVDIKAGRSPRDKIERK